MKTALAQTAIHPTEARMHLSSVEQSGWKQTSDSPVDLITFRARSGVANIILQFSDHMPVLHRKPQFSITEGSRVFKTEHADILTAAAVKQIAEGLKQDRSALRAECAELLASPESILNNMSAIRCTKSELVNKGAMYRLEIPRSNFQNQSNLSFIVEICHNIGEASPFKGGSRAQGYSLAVSAQSDQHQIRPLRIPSSKNSRLESFFNLAEAAYSNKLFAKPA